MLDRPGEEAYDGQAVLASLLSTLPYEQQHQILMDMHIS